MSYIYKICGKLSLYFTLPRFINYGTYVNMEDCEAMY